MFSAVGTLYGTQLSLQDLRLSNVASVLSTHEAWIDFRRGTISALCRWRRQHTFLPDPAISWKVAFDFFRHTVGTAHSDVLEEAGQRRPMRPFRFLYQRLASAASHRWETYLERRVQAKGWDGPMLRRAPLPRSVPQSHRWFLLKPHLNAPIASARLQRESLMKPHSVASVPVTQTVWIICRVASKCLTFLIVFLLLQICLQYLMDASAPCYKNDGREVRWLALRHSWLPSGMSDRCASVVYASSHSLNVRIWCS